MCPSNTASESKSAPQPVEYPPPQVLNPPPPQALNPAPAAPGIAPVAPPTSSQLPGQWTTGLCDCFKDTDNCCVTFFCPCVTFGQNAEVIDQGTISCYRAVLIYVTLCSLGMVGCYTCTYRSKLRGHYSLPGGQCSDFWVHCCCANCAFCQEYRELKNRGRDPSMGWVAIRQKMQPVPGIVHPPVQMGMMR